MHQYLMDFIALRARVKFLNNPIAVSSLDNPENRKVCQSTLRFERKVQYDQEASTQTR